MNPSTTSKLLDTFEHSRDDMQTTLVVKLSAVRSFVLEDGATYHSVEFENTYLSSIQFGVNCTVKNLRIKRSKLTHLPTSLHRLKDLNELSITHSHIQVINFNGISGLPGLQLLDLTKNKIHSVYCTPEKDFFPVLADMFLRENRLRNINVNLFNAMKVLEKIDLSHNPISVLSGSLVSSGLHFLDLSHNRLQSVDCCSWKLPNVYSLLLTDNRFNSLPRCIEQAFANVTQMDLSNNELYPSEMFVIGKLTKLYYLTLNNNKLTHLTLDERTIPKGLKYLGLGKNRLKHLAIPYIPNEETFIDVSLNCITSLDIDKVSPNLTKLVMAHNPLDCSFGTLFKELNAKKVCKESENKSCDLSET
uniref:Leucine rich immune protein (Coil-less) n=1 Tax=Anopheles culicifacies TaxID=139723 RepID=A0A2C9GUL7_9DIPT